MGFRERIALTARHFRDPYPSINSRSHIYRGTQWCPRTTLIKRQTDAWQKLVDHCWRHVPYYRDVFERSGAIGTDPVRLTSLPILTKPLLRENFERLKSTDIESRKWFINRSGGSTGEPVALLQDRDYFINSQARKNIPFEWAGLKPGGRMIRLWGSESDIIRGGIGAKAAIKEFVNNSITLNAFRMTPHDMRRYLNIINRKGPAVIHAYAHAVYELARFAEADGIEVKPQISVISTSGTLHNFILDTVSRVFGCDVFNQYGSREVSCIAADCAEHKGLHISMETLIVEVLDEENKACLPGVEGDVVVTSLCNFVMPLVRYRIGDRATIAKTPCPCGRGLPTLASVGGRNMECFRRRDGAIIPAEYFIHFIGVVLNRGWIKKTQLIQKDYDNVELKIVADSHRTDTKVVQELATTVQKVMGSTCEIHVTFHNDIPPSDSGKYHYTICELDLPAT